MKKLLLFALISSLSLFAPSQVADAAPRGSLLDYYDRIPGKHFTGFGGVNRRALLKRKGTIVDYKHKFIEIPGSASPKDGDLHKLQISLLPNGKEPWVAVSRLVWDQERTPGTLNFYYGYNDAGGLREAAPDFFPDKPKRVEYMGAQLYEVAILPRKGLTISIGLPLFHGVFRNYKYNPKADGGKSYFVRLADTGG